MAFPSCKLSEYSIFNWNGYTYSGMDAMAVGGLIAAKKLVRVEAHGFVGSSDILAALTKEECLPGHVRNKEHFIFEDSDIEVQFSG